MPPETLSRRAANRALPARRLLLEPVRATLMRATIRLERLIAFLAPAATRHTIDLVAR